MWIGIVAFVVSGITHVYSFWANVDPVGPIVWSLHIGLAVVWIPAIVISRRLFRNVKEEEYWRGILLIGILRACPHWVRWSFFLVLAYAAVNFLFYVVDWTENGQANTVRMLSGHWMFLYYAASITFIANQNLERFINRTCPNGHAVSAFADVCEECGEQVATPNDGNANVNHR